jgi:hypothetical protein
MKALIFKRYGGLDQVTFADIPRPVGLTSWQVLRDYDVVLGTDHRHSLARGSVCFVAPVLDVHHSEVHSFSWLLFEMRKGEAK